MPIIIRELVITATVDTNAAQPDGFGSYATCRGSAAAYPGVC